MAGFDIPPGLILFEDPPIHDLHRGLLSRVFTPKAMNAIEPKVREFCARTLDPLVDGGRLRLHRRSRRGHADAHDRHAARHPGGGPGGDPRPDRRGTAPRRRHRGADGRPRDGRRRALLRLHRVAGRAPVRRPHDPAPQRRVRGRDGDDAQARPDRGAHLRDAPRRRRQRDHDPADRLDRQAARRAPRPAARARGRPVAGPPGDRGDPAHTRRRRRSRPARSTATSSTTGRRCPRAASW